MATMYDKRGRRSAVVFAAILGLSGAFFAGVALAADVKLDEANDAITKAIALLKAADNPNISGKPEFAGHRAKAIARLEEAKAEIAKAKQFADKPAPPPPSSGPPHHAPPPPPPPIKKPGPKTP
jgi:hypothetical protein